MDVEQKEILYQQSLFLLRVLYSKLLDILDALCGEGRFVLMRNSRLNYYYVVIKKSVEQILEEKGFEDLAKENPQLFESLIGDIEEADMEWEFISKTAYDFLGKIENLYILSGARSFELAKPIKDKLEEANEAIREHKELCAKAWKGMTDNIEKNKSKFGWGDEKPKEEKAIAISGTVSFYPDKSVLMIGKTEIKIKKFSDQYHFLKIAFDSNDLKREWFFSEIADKYDIAGAASIDDKKFYNAVYQIDQKIIKDAGIRDFFIKRTSQSFQINPKYLP